VTSFILFLDSFHRNMPSGLEWSFEGWEIFRFCFSLMKDFFFVAIIWHFCNIDSRRLIERRLKTIHKERKRSNKEEMGVGDNTHHTPWIIAIQREMVQVSINSYTNLSISIIIIITTPHHTSLFEIFEKFSNQPEKLLSTCSFHAQLVNEKKIIAHKYD
jgi:hypothetical protein